MSSQPDFVPSEGDFASLSPAESIGRHLRWQLLLALAGILILATLLGYSAYNTPTVLVPAQGGVFREGVAGSPRYINPLRCDVTEVDYDLCAALYRGLTRVDRNGRTVPDLAEGWTISPDGLTYEFRLRVDQYWDDGRPVTADDVVFTVNVLQDPEVFTLPALTSLWQTVRVEKIDDHTVRFTLREPFSPFLDYTTIGLLARHAYESLSPAEVVTRFNDRPVGNGPMKLTRLDANHVRLEPNLFYSTRTPYLEALELWFYPDHQSLLTAEANGEIEGVSRVLPRMMEGVLSRPELHLFSSELPNYYNITLNLDNPNAPFLQEKDVRQALMLGLNREELIQTVASGQGILAHSPILPENWAYNPDVRQYPYDPAAARALLDAAGWVDTNGDGVREKNGRSLQFQLHTNDDPLRVELIYAIARQWEQIGVRAIAIPVSFAGLVNDILAPRRFEAALISWETPGDPDPYPLWHSSQAEDPGQNYGSWRNEQADQIMEQARKTLLESERKELYAQFQSIFAEELPALLLYYPVYTYGVNEKVQNVQIGALNHPSERFAGFADWYMVTRRVPASQAPPSAPPTPPGSTPVLSSP